MAYNNTARQHVILDAELILADEVTSTSSVARGQVSGADGGADVGTGRWNGLGIVDASAMAVDGGDEGYYFEFIGIAPNGDLYTLGVIELGHSDAFLGSGDVNRAADGRYAVPISNVVGLNAAGTDDVVCDTIYVAMTAAGTTKTITWSSFLAQDPF